MPVGVVGGQRHAQVGGGQLPCPDGGRGGAAGEAGDDVRAAAGGGQLDACAHVVADPGVGGGGQSGAGAADDADGRQVVHGGFDAQLGHGQQVLGAGAEDGDLVTGRQLPQDVRSRLRCRAAVVGAGGGTGQQGGDDQVPHHPVGGGVPQQAVPGAQIGVQAEDLEVLEQDPAVAVDDALGQAGGAGGEHDPQRVVERHLGEREVLGAGGRVLPGHRQPRVPALGPGKAHVVHAAPWPSASAGRAASSSEAVRRSCVVPLKR